MLTINIPLDFKSINQRVQEESRERRLKVEKLFSTMIYKDAKAHQIDISFEDLKSHELDVEFEFPSINNTSIISRRIETGEKDTLRFVSEFSKSAVIKRHNHHNCDEVFYVPKDSGGQFLIISGTESSGDLEYHLLNEENNGKKIPYGVIHQISNIGKKSSKLITEVKKVL